MPKKTKRKIQNSPHYWDDAIKHLSKDKVLKNIITTYKGEFMSRKNDGFHTLARSIVGQQISVKAADSVWKKFEALLKGKIEPKAVLKLSDKKMRSAGLSEMKVNYMRNVARFFVEEMEGTTDLINHDHEIVAAKLIEVKGIGKWTVDMFMMFHMHAPDIFPIGDLGLVNAVKRHYGLEKKLSAESLELSAKKKPLSAVSPKLSAKQKKELEKLILKTSEPWKPYRTVATWYLWRSLDPVPVEY